MRLTRPAAAFAAFATIATGTAFAADTKPAAAKPATDVVVAKVDHELIHMSDVQAAIAQLPPEVAQRVGPDVVYAKMLDQVISKRALLIEARKANLEKDPAVRKQIADQTDQILTQAVLKTQLKDSMSEDNIKKVYDRDYAGKPGEQEVHARHILVDTEAKAKDIIAQLNAPNAPKFEDMAKKFGDPKDSATQQGGDLGYFKKGDMLPEFSAVAFTLKPGTFTQTPVHTRYGWHVINVVDTRISQPPTYDSVRQEIGQKLVQEGVQAAIVKAKAQVKITEYNQDGTPMKPAAKADAKPAAKPAAPAK